MQEELTPYHHGRWHPEGRVGVAGYTTMTVMCEVLEGGNYEVKNVITFYHMNEPQYIRRALQCIW